MLLQFLKNKQNNIYRWKGYSIFFQILGNADNYLAWLLLVQQPFHCSEQCNSTEAESYLMNETYWYAELYFYHITITLFHFHFYGVRVVLGASKWACSYPYTFLVLLFQHSCRLSHERHSEQAGQHTPSHGDAHQCSAGLKMD